MKDSVVPVQRRFHTPFEDSVVLSTNKNLRLEPTTTPQQNPLNHAPSHTKELNCKIYIQKIKIENFRTEIKNKIYGKINCPLAAGTNESDSKSSAKSVVSTCIFSSTKKKCTSNLLQDPESSISIDGSCATAPVCCKPKEQKKRKRYAQS
jgi:hypothetical protein